MKKTIPLLFCVPQRPAIRKKTLWNQLFDANFLCLLRPNGLADCETAHIAYAYLKSFSLPYVLEIFSTCIFSDEEFESEIRF